MGAWAVAGMDSIGRRDQIRCWMAGRVHRRGDGAATDGADIDLRGDPVDGDIGYKVGGQRDEGDILPVRADDRIVTVAVSRTCFVGVARNANGRRRGRTRSNT